MTNNNQRMDWDRLICGKRLGLEHVNDKKETIRSDFQRDYDRLVFSSPFRRLQNKTQVFPLPGSIFVHNRLTHSLEVSSVGKSLASEVARKLREKYSDQPWVKKFHNIEEIVGCGMSGTRPWQSAFRALGGKINRSILQRRRRA